MEFPPKQLDNLVKWLAEGVQKEITALEKDGGYQKYELISGRLERVLAPTQAIYQFVIVDGNRIPEDSVGRIKIDSAEYEAKVCSQHIDYIQLQINFETDFMPNIPRAILLIDDTQLLHSLMQALEKRSSEHSDNKALAVFNPELANVSSASLPNYEDFNEITDDQRKTMEKAFGSDITYIWGPPGTGKTFVIAHLILAFAITGQRVLVTSHTNAAVDQILFTMLQFKGKPNKPIWNEEVCQEGNVLRIGPALMLNKIPDYMRLDKIIEKESSELKQKIDYLKTAAEQLSHKKEPVTERLSEWETLTNRIDEYEGIKRTIDQFKDRHKYVKKSINDRELNIEKFQSQLTKAEKAWFNTKDKMNQASIKLQKEQEKLEDEKSKLLNFNQAILEAESKLVTAELLVNSQRITCDRLPSQEILVKQVKIITDEIENLTKQISAIRLEIDDIEKAVISKASIIFATLTKIYTGRELENENFDVVIIDEISMALPPTILLAAFKATTRVVLVGDFLQLPPVVRGTDQETNPQLNMDVFHLAQVAKDMKAATNCPVLTKLSVQKRMDAQIADIARHLAYSEAGLKLKDDKETLDRRSIPSWVKKISAKALMIVDTTEMHCWSGKQPQTLSRFNFYSANVAIELARKFIDGVTPPGENGTIPIGIVTPYAAQRRILSQLVIDAKLEPWVKVGTVHTFQGGEAEIIIFDSVLDEPYWSARLCTPRDANEVLRDLNVAVTRAKYRFIFLGSSAWMNKHANVNSGLGKLWSFLIQKADLIPVGNFFEEHSIQMELNFNNTTGWNYEGEEEYKFELLDEQSFFPHFTKDLANAQDSIFGLAPYFGQFRWPQIEPLFRAALQRGVNVTLIVPTIDKNTLNKTYVEKVIENLRAQGALIIIATGLHGKDVLIDQKILYTGSMNWSSHRGRVEIIHRINSPSYAQKWLDYIQGKYIQISSFQEDNTPRVCPFCKSPIIVINQRKQRGIWDRQALKVGCSNPDCKKYLRNIDERPPIKHAPVCEVDGKTQYKRVTRGRGEVWQCPKHPKEYIKVVPGDSEG